MEIWLLCLLKDSQNAIEQILKKGKDNGLMTRDIFKLIFNSTLYVILCSESKCVLPYSDRMRSALGVIKIKKFEDISSQ